MTAPAYPPPVEALFALGDPHLTDPIPPPLTPEEFEQMLKDDTPPVLTKHVPRPLQSETWQDYRALGIGPEHISDLIQIVEDEALWDVEADDPAGFAQTHAWRALGQLRAEEAIRPLVALLEPYDDWDWFTEEVPDVFGLIGPAAIPTLAAFLANPMRPIMARTTASNGLEKIARIHPEARAACIDAITQTIEESLASTARGDALDDLAELNGFLVSDLIDAEAVETLPLITRAFAADRVDESITGDLEDVEIAFGVRVERDTPRPRYNLFSPPPRPPGDDPSLPPGGSIRPTGSAPKKDKHKRKIAQQSRRVNRKKKK